MISLLLGASMLLQDRPLGGQAFREPDASPRYRKVLANGIRLIAEKTPDLGQAVLVMAVSRARAPGTAETHGWLHLIEHLSAIGAKKDVDQRLEAQGMTLTASNTRDAILYEVRGTPEQLPFAARVLRDIATAFSPTKEEVAAEAGTIEEEMALQSPSAPLSAKAWTTVFGDEGLDSMGDLGAIRKASPEGLAALYKNLFTGRAMALSAAGDFDPKSAGLRLEEVFATIPPGPEFEAPLRSAAYRPQIIPADGSGTARAALTEGLDTTAGLAALGAALSLCLQEPDLTMTYSPSLWRGLIVVSGRSRASFASLDRMDKAERESLQPLVKAVLETYLRSEKGSPSRLARFHAQIALQNPTITLERLLELSKAVTPEQAGEAFESFSQASALTVEGSR